MRVKYGLKPGDEQWADWSATEIAVAMDAGRVVINPLIYAEVSVGYQTIEELEERLPASDFEREPLPYLAGFAAGKAFVRYRRSGGGKRSPLPDFYIGAHVAVAGYRLLTRDVPRYRTTSQPSTSSPLRLGEREGIGVDRIVRDMLAIGRPEPEISEITGPYVRVSLVGGGPDPETLEFLATLEPAATASDIDALLIIDHLTRTGWIDTATAMPVVQRPEAEA